MNAPRGFRLEHGELTHIDPLRAMFNPAWATETSHMIVGALLATAFGVASVYARRACCAAATTPTTGAGSRSA